MNEYTEQDQTRSVYVCFEGEEAEIGIALTSRPSQAQSALISATGADTTQRHQHIPLWAIENENV